MAGIKDVAKKAGVSISTVSNVINHTKYVSPELQRRVEVAVKELSYQANPVAQRMKSNKSGIIGVITADMCGMFYPYVVKGIYSVANEMGYQIVICDSRGVYGEVSALERERQQFQNLFNNRMDGIIFASIVPQSMEKNHIKWIKKMAGGDKKISLVSIERNFQNYGVDSVYMNGKKGAAMAVEHLLDCGCRKICHITGPTYMAIAAERVEGYHLAMAAAGIEVNDKTMIVEGDYSHQSGYLGMKELLNKCPDLDGVFVSNDQMAVGAMKVLKEYNVKVPEQVKLIGYDDVFISSVLEPPLSTIHVRKLHAGVEAAKLLFEKIEHKDSEEQPKTRAIEMQSSLTIRNSTVKDAPPDWILSEW